MARPELASREDAIQSTWSNRVSSEHDAWDRMPGKILEQALESHDVTDAGGPGQSLLGCQFSAGWTTDGLVEDPYGPRAPGP